MEYGDEEMNEDKASSVPGSPKKHKSSVPVPTDDVVEDRIKTFKKTIPGPKRTDNEWTEMSRSKLHHDTVKDKLAGDGHSRPMNNGSP